MRSRATIAGVAGGMLAWVLSLGMPNVLRRDCAAAAGRYAVGPIETLAGHLLRSGIHFAHVDYSDAAVPPTSPRSG